MRQAEASRRTAGARGRLTRAKTVALALLTVTALHAPTALARAAASPSMDDTGAALWRRVLTVDLEAARAFVLAQDISAAYPDPAAFRRRVDAADAVATQQAAAVDSFAGYSAVLKRFVNSLDDEHTGVTFSVLPSGFFWPGLVLRREGDRYVTAASTLAGVPDGQEVTACDGEPIGALVTRTSIYSGGHAGLEATKTTAALAALIDPGDPFFKRPAACVIGGRHVDLAWSRLSYADYLHRVAPLRGAYDRTVGIAPLGDDVAWVKLGVFQPQTAAEAAAFHRVIDGAPALRDKRAIVIDVRHNGGGPYDWMMAFISSLFGADNAAYYARARLAIQPVYRATPEVVKAYRQDDTQDASLGVPFDPPTHIDAAKGLEDALNDHHAVYKAMISPPPQAATAPPQLVHARVFVLTDSACGSVCIGFVDELKRFPGVKQIGTDTAADSRAGSPMTQTSPSGLAAIRVPTMTRDGRLRGDHGAQPPDLLFGGDINDTAAVQRWVLTDVLSGDPARRGSAS